MRLSRRNLMGMLVAAVSATWAASSLSDARANETYNFNDGPQGWYAENYNTGTTTWAWLPGPSDVGNRWSVDGENRPAGDVAANYLYSPIFMVDNPIVEVLVSHRFNFATGTVPYGSGTSPTGLGQLQWRILSSSTAWVASPATFSANAQPTFPLPTDWFPLATGTAWEGISESFGSGSWKTTKADIPMAIGDIFQLRFVNADLGPFNEGYVPTPAWQIDDVQIRAATAIVPEPGTLALLGIGGGILVLARLRRTPRGRTLGRSTVVALAVVAASLAMPTGAKADVLFDFQINSNGNVPGVTWSGTYQPSTVALSKRWTYSDTGDKRWGVLAAGADSASSPKAAHLTSSTFSGIVDGVPAQNARISLAHNFFLPPSGTGGPRPISLGQLQYQINNSGTWVGLPLAAFTSGSSINDEDPVFGPSPFKNPLYPVDPTPIYVNQTAFVAPTYVTATTAPLLSYVAPGGASFVGQTTGWSSLYVPSQAFLNINTGLVPEGITSMQLRLTNANLGGNCTNNEGWNVRMLSVEFDSIQPPVPEPTTLALAVAGGGAACVARALRRRRSPAALEAE